MSSDIKIQNKCDHLINWEKATLYRDKRSIEVSYRIAAVASLNLRINNVVISSEDYDVVPKSTIKVVEPYFYILMKEKIRHYDPLIEAKYTTFLDYCPKCEGVRVVDDSVYTQSGDFKMIENEFLLVQNVEKYIITKLGSNVFHDWIGTNLHSLVGSKVMDLDALRTRVIDQVNGAIEKFRRVQKQLQGTNRLLTPGELFGELISVLVEQTDDPTMILVTVVFTAQSGRTLEFSQFLELSELRRRRALV